MRRIVIGIMTTIVVGTIGSGLLLHAAFEWAIAQVFPQPYADETVGLYLTAIQSSDGPAAERRVITGVSWGTADAIRDRWTDCAAQHGPLTGVETRSVFFAPEQVDVTVRFADGTESRWRARLSPHSSSGWQLTTTAPPACFAQP
jgi:hypothetical protein